MLLIVIRTMVQDFTIKEHVICVSMIIVIMKIRTIFVMMVLMDMNVILNTKAHYL